MAAQSHLALTLLMAGRERACHDLAVEVLAACDAAAVELPATRQRAEIARQFVELQSLPVGPAPDPTYLAPIADDLAGRHWSRVLTVRLALRRRSVAEAQRRLELPLDTPPPPPHLQTQLVFERALLGLLTGDREALRRSADELRDLGATAEEAWVNATLADLDGDLRTAVDLYTEASRARGRGQPPTEALALVCAAQLRDYLGDREPARELLVQAVGRTQSRGLAAPFLGLSTHGTRVGVLLAETPAIADSPWGVALRETCVDLPSIASIFRPLVATQRELDSAVEPAVTPVLSPREHEVLGELARGSTYSDIAASLFVSENTVKTHISSLYSKLSVGRRSEALAVARKMHLL